MDGLNSAHPRPPVPPEQVDDAVAVFEEQLMAMEFQRLDIEEEMRLGMAPSSDSRLHVLCEDDSTSPCDATTDELVNMVAREDSENDAAFEAVGAEEVLGAEGEHGLRPKALLADWQHSALAAASVAPANHFSDEDSRPSVRNKDEKTSSCPGPAVPTLYRRAAPKWVECTHPNSISRHDVRHATPPTAAQNHNRTKPVGRHAGYASARVATIAEVRQSETLRAQRARLTKQRVDANISSAQQHYERRKRASIAAILSARAAMKTRLLKENRLKKRRDLIRRFLAPRLASTALQRRAKEARTRRGDDQNRRNGITKDQELELELVAVSNAVAKTSPRTAHISPAALEAAYKKRCVDMLSSMKADKSQVQPLSGRSALRILQILSRTREKIER